MDNISFTGIKNIGYFNAFERNRRTPCLNAMIIQLTDDFNGKDLTEFNNIVKGCRTSEKSYKFPYDSRFLHIMTTGLENRQSIPELFVNWIKVPPQRKTMPLFTYIAKLTRRISSMNLENFVVEKDFKYGGDGSKYIFPYKSLSELIPQHEELSRCLDFVYSPSFGKLGASRINSDIQAQMVNYLG